jgi:hypothetical protein
MDIGFALLLSMLLSLVIFDELTIYGVDVMLLIHNPKVKSRQRDYTD